MSNPTIRDVADRAGVSTSAVSIYLNNRNGIGQATTKRIAAAIHELGYIPRANSRRPNGTAFLGLLVEKLPLSLQGDHFYAEVADGIQAEAERLGYNLTISILNQPEVTLPRIIVEQHVAGVLAVGGGDITDELLVLLVEQNMPLVLVDNVCRLRNIESVMVDNHRGAYLATRHLLDLGHERIAIIRGPEKYKSLTERYHGYLQAMFDAGIVPDATLIQEPLSKGIPRKGYREMQNLIAQPQPPTAVFAVTDRTALGAMDALKEAGLYVPQDISMVGFDDIRPDAYSYTSLTTITTNRLEMGRVAVRRMNSRILDPSQIPLKTVLHADLVVRKSTAPHARI